MKNFYLTLLGASFCSLSVFAQVNPLPGAVSPETSTVANPKVYNLMSSHITATDRQNRFLTWDGTTLKTPPFTSGSSDSDQESKYWWRLEAGEDGTVILVNQETDQQVTLPEDAFSVGNPLLGVSSVGEEWILATSASTGQASTVANQYCLRVKNAPQTKKYYLNAMDTSFDFKITLYDMGTHQASGWFFYPVSDDLITSVSSATQTSIRLFPNPCSDYLQVTGVEDDVVLSVYNIAGVEILNTTKNRLNTASLLPGTYILKIVAADGTKLMKFNKK
ncbi:MAG: T9SS type A sorting domain-containing protein [Bacteroidales bacterium]